MDLSKLRIPPGVSITVYAGELPPELTPVGEPSSGIEDAVVVIARYRGEEIFHMATRRELWSLTGELDVEFMQGTIDHAVEEVARKFPPLKLED